MGKEYKNKTNFTKTPKSSLVTRTFPTVLYAFTIKNTISGTSDGVNLPSAKTFLTD